MAENLDLKFLKVNRSDFSDPVKAAEWTQKKLGMGFEVKIQKTFEVFISLKKAFPFCDIFDNIKVTKIYFLQLQKWPKINF